MLAIRRSAVRSEAAARPGAGYEDLRAVRDGLIEMMDLHPTLTGKDDDIKVHERLRFGGRYPGDPNLN